MVRQEGRDGLYESGAWCVLFVFGIGERDVMRARERGRRDLVI